MRRRHLVLVLSVLGLLILFCTGADQWPFPVTGMTSVLGGDEQGSFLPGSAFEGAGDPVKPAMTGEMVYHTDPRDSAFPTNYEGVIVLDHENSFRTIYGGLEPDPRIFRMTTIDTEQVLGTTSQLWFSVYDMKLGQYVNPSRILPGIGDRQPPRIKNVQIVGAGVSSSLGGSMSLKPGIYDLFVNCDDSFPGRTAKTDLFPYEIVLTSNGEVLSGIRFDSLKTENGIARLTGNPPLSWDELFERDGYLKLGRLNLTSGRSVLIVLVKDPYGNQSEWVSVINVR